MGPEERHINLTLPFVVLLCCFFVCVVVVGFETDPPDNQPKK